MKLIGYSGIEGVAIVIQRPSDLYPLLDWFQSEMMDIVNSEAPNSGEAEVCANFCTELMERAEEAGFGTFDEIEKVEYG